MRRASESRGCFWTWNTLTNLLERNFGRLCFAVALLGLGSCGAGTISNPFDQECTATRCAELGKNCGEIVVDGCGPVRCGDCVAPETCGGAGTPDVCGAGDCKPSWECEQPLNGNERDGCGNRRPDPACAVASPCGNGVTDPGEPCDWNGNVGCSGSTPVCESDCSGCTAGDEECTSARCTELGKDCGEVVIGGCGAVQCGDCKDPQTCGGSGEPNVCGTGECKPSWECEQPLNGNEKDGCGNRRPSAACDATSPLWNGDFDTGNSSQYTLYNRCVPNRLTFDSTITRTGRGFSGRFELRSGEKCNSPTGERMQAQKNGLGFGEGADVYYGLSLYIATGAVTFSGEQFFQVVGSSFSPLADMSIYKNLYYSRYGNVYSTQTIVSWGPFDGAGQWIDFVMRVKWRSNHGVIQIWKKKARESKYELLLSNLDTPTLPPGSKADGLGIGIYRMPNTETRIWYIDEMKVGTTFGDVALGSPP